MIIVFFLFLIISYLLFNAIPGNAFSSLLLNPLLPPETYQRTIELFGLDKPLFERVQLYIINFFKGDFGYSYIYYPRSPIEVIAESKAKKIATACSEVSTSDASSSKEVVNLLSTSDNKELIASSMSGKSYSI